MGLTNGMIADYKQYCHNLGRHYLVGQLPKQFDTILDTILAAGNQVDYYKIYALLNNANADLGDKKLAEPYAWMVGF